MEWITEFKTSESLMIHKFGSDAKVMVVCNFNDDTIKVLVDSVIQNVYDLNYYNKVDDYFALLFNIARELEVNKREDRL